MAQGSLSTDDLAGRSADEQHGAPEAPEDPYPQEVAQQEAAGTGSAQQAEQYAPLLDDQEADGFADRWRDVQARFVDDPQGAVRDGDGLVAELMQALAQRFSEQKAGLQEQWDRGDEPDTEQMRRAFQEYRSFFHRLLST